MKHATPVALDALEPLLADLRGIEGLSERKRGVFYRKSQAALHFHEDPAGFFADVRLGQAWVRELEDDHTLEVQLSTSNEANTLPTLTVRMNEI